MCVNLNDAIEIFNKGNTTEFLDNLDTIFQSNKYDDNAREKIKFLREIQDEVYKRNLISSIIKGVKDEYEFIHKVDNIDGSEAYRSDFDSKSLHFNRDNPTNSNIVTIEDIKELTETRVVGFSYYKLLANIIEEIETSIFVKSMFPIFIEGPECSGKTNLIKYLKLHFNREEVNILENGKYRTQDISINKPNIIFFDDLDIMKTMPGEKENLITDLFVKCIDPSVTIIPIFTMRSGVSSIATKYKGKVFKIPCPNRAEINEILNNYFIKYSNVLIRLTERSIKNIIDPLFSMRVSNKLKVSIDIYKSLCIPTLRKEKTNKRVKPALVNLDFDKEVVLKHIEKIIGTRVSLDYDSIYNDLKFQIRSKIIGQDDIIDSIIPTLTNVKMGIFDPSKPAGVFFFYGPTGTGKSETAKVIADLLYNGKYHKEDMNSYKDAISVTRIFGSPPGYIGHDNETGLMNFISNNHSGVILLDEIEKADHSVIDSFMEMFDTGYVKDSKGISHDIGRFIIIMTSNITFGKKHRSLGFTSKEEKSVDNNREEILSTQFFKPEFIGRINQICKFNEIEDKHLDMIADIILSKIIENISNIIPNVGYTKEDKDKVIKSYIKEQGVRSMSQYANTYIRREIFERFHAKI